MSEILAPTMDQPATTGIMEHIRNSRLGEMTAKVAVLAAFVGGGEMVAADVASADVNSGGSTITHEDSNTIIIAGKSHMSENSFASATVMTNDRTISKAKINELKAEGNCEVFNGKKVDIHTAGHVEGGGVADGRDTRKSLFCHDSEGWFRAACGNRAWINVAPPKPIENVIWAGNKFKLRVVTKANATAEATCTTPDGLATATSFGHGMGYAAETLRYRSGSKAHSKGASSELIIETELAAKAKARSHAGAKAAATCIETGGTVVTPPPKDSTQGPGEGTPGQPGGPGAGGQPGNPSVGETCRDDQGNIVSGPHDQFGNC